MRLKSRTAVVIGASKGIERPTSLALASEGANVVMVARTEKDLLEVQAATNEIGTGARALAVSADASDEPQVERLKKAAEEEFGQVDILINNVGVGKNGKVANLSTADYDWIMNTNMRSTWLRAKAFIPPMLQRKAGAVIFVSSVAGLAALSNEPIYCPNKFAQLGFAQSIDYEVYPNDVKVSVVAPGGTNTNYGFYDNTRRPGDPCSRIFTSRRTSPKPSSSGSASRPRRGSSLPECAP